MRLLGQSMLCGSAFAFSGVTVLMKLAIAEGKSPPTAAFLRFAVGLVGILPLVIRNRKRLVPNRPWLVFLRGLSNSGAVLLVFTALSLTTVTKTNLLNMTAPVFVFALAPLLNRERSPLLYFLLLIVTMAGSFLVVLSVLREALLWALGGSGCSLVAQTLLTVGYRHVPASEGSLISATRILIAAVLGYLVFGDLVTFRSFVGGSLILGSLATIGVHSRREESRGEEAAVGTPSGI